MLTSVSMPRRFAVFTELEMELGPLAIDHQRQVSRMTLAVVTVSGDNFRLVMDTGRHDVRRDQFRHDRLRDQICMVTVLRLEEWLSSGWRRTLGRDQIRPDVPHDQLRHGQHGDNGDTTHGMRRVMTKSVVASFEHFIHFAVLMFLA
jgi:hypothetical protein